MARRMAFHVGEFANMTGVNKRTLHYYDEEGIFKPEEIEPNGYRSYSYRQIYPFYMIRLFRQMGLDIKEIKEYMNGRTPANFWQLLTQQEAWLDQEIANLRYMKRLVKKKRELVAKARSVECDVVTECEFESLPYVISMNLREFEKRDDIVTMEKVLAEHMREAVEQKILDGYTLGVMVDPKDFMAPEYANVISYYCIATSKSLRNIPQERQWTRPKGRYVVIYFRGDCMKTDKIYAKLRNYMQAHNLQPTGYSYEESLLEDMSTANPDEYLTRIAIPVAKVK